ncbi:MAG: hypothetical protein GXO94_07340 [Nitrospirae bacterium]|nr:hypothetical protein [Nitrospirota bacterium]
MFRKRCISIPLTLTFMIFMICAPLGQVRATGIVICIGDDDHIAMEVDYNAMHCRSTQDTGWTAPYSTPVMSGDGDSSSCLDIPLLVVSPCKNQKISSLFHYNLSKASGLLYRTSSAETILDDAVFPGRVLPEKTSAVASAATSLRTVVLLI